MNNKCIIIFGDTTYIHIYIYTQGNQKEIFMGKPLHK